MSKIIELETCENIPKYTGLSNDHKIGVEDRYNWYGHSYGICVGIIYDDGSVKSNFKKDTENSNTEIFDKLREDMNLIEKRADFRDYNTFESRSGTKYYITYKVKNHSSSKPTVTDCYIERCSNVHYSVEYEILLVADEEYSRYITVDFETEGMNSISFFDQVKDMEETFEEWFEEESNGFKEDEDGIRTVRFYNNVGQCLDIEIESIDELLSMITSIRMIKCEQKIID
jgi:putative lipase involved disintegration of autophagic bodies